ncbi:MAG TPA: Uma2 family endonuclease [Thermomicrobiales bacterium]|nr:Uma2 family endonuclease [Thermomicrobiales bacterium]
MTATRLMTAEEFWTMPEVPGKQYELVNGELVEMPTASHYHNLIVFLIGKLVDAFASQHDLGYTFVDGVSFVLRRNPDDVRGPDVSFVATARVTSRDMLLKPWEGAPDLAVEIISPSDRATDIDEKIKAYLSAGTRLIWVVWPDTQSVTTYELGGAITDLRSTDTLGGGDVLPGFAVSVATLFEVGPAR